MHEYIFQEVSSFTRKPNEFDKYIGKKFTMVDKVAIGKNKYKYILNGKIHGNVLFYDIKSLGKYIEKIHPSVGDIVTIDFPDEKNREKYEITECFDKQLT